MVRLRHTRTKWSVAILALIALVAQSFVVLRHSAAMAAERAELALAGKDLQAFGIDLASALCRESSGQTDGKTVPGGKPMSCLYCAAMASGHALPPVQTIALAAPARDPTWIAAGVALILDRTDPRPRTRAPPAFV